jgi:phytoene dehydrogenase-like protein
MSEVVIIGAGLAGLSCAMSLEGAGTSVSLLEASGAPGGRVRTDMVEGFRLDRGFQVLLTAYPEAKRLLDYVQRLPLSAGMIDRFFEPFFEPFFGGVFLERELVTSSRFFEFLFRMFTAGDTAIPATGMQQIPLQLAAKLPTGTLVTGARVRKVTRNAHSFQVEIDGRDSLEARAVLLAVAGNEATRCWGGVGGWSVPEVRAWNSTTAFCYAAEQPPVNESIILLNGEGRGAGPVNHAAVMTADRPPMRPQGPTWWQVWWERRRRRRRRWCDWTTESVPI